MLYDEFIKGTGCKMTEHNYQVYKELELIYMNSDCSKQHIYDMGKKLCDNTPTDEELALRGKIMLEIERRENQVKENQKKINFEKEWYGTDTRYVRALRIENRGLRNDIQTLKEMIA